MYMYKSSARRRRRQPTLRAAPYMERRVSAATTTDDRFNSSIVLSYVVGHSVRGVHNASHARASITGGETFRDMPFYRP